MVTLVSPADGAQYVAGDLVQIAVDLQEAGWVTGQIISVDGGRSTLRPNS